MQMLMVCCESGLDEKVVAALEDLGAPGYTVCEGLKGLGSTGPKHDTPIWPGSSVVVHTCIEDELVPQVVERVREARDSHLKRPGCCVFAVPVERLL